MSYRSTILPILVLLLLAGQSRAQEPRRVMAGPSGGYEYGAQFGSAAVFAGAPDCGVFEGGSVSGSALGGRLLLPDLFSPGFGVQAGIVWRRADMALQAQPANRQFLRDPLTDTTVLLDRSYRADIRSSMAALELMASWSAGNLQLALGPWFARQTGFQARTFDTIAGPGRISFEDGLRSRAITEGTTFTENAFQYGLVLRGGWSVPLGRSMQLVPEASVRVALASPVQEAHWAAVTAGAGVSLLFNLTPAVTPLVVPAPDTLQVVQRPVHKPRLAASITISGVDQQGQVERVAAVRVNEILYRTFTPLLPVLFFERNSASFLSRYHRPEGPPQTGFTVDSIRHRGMLDLHRFNLDIIGSRLARESSARIELHGLVSSDETPVLAAERADSVRAYLMRRWGIPAARITIARDGGTLKRSGETTEDGREENRRVEVTSSSSAILAPIVSERVAREFNPPEIDMRPMMDAEAGVKEWTLTVLQGGAEVARYTSADTASGERDIRWHIADERIDSIPSPLAVELRVEDSTGAVVTARDEMPITVQRRVHVVEQRGERRADRIIHSLVAFEYDSPEPGPLGTAGLRDAAADLTDGARVHVIGFTDRIGDDVHNSALSRQRAERIASALRGLAASRGLRDVTVTTEAGGKDVNRFTNDLAEGRMFSRGVNIVIERAPDPGER